MDMEESVGLRECNIIHNKLKTCTGMYTFVHKQILKYMKIKVITQILLHIRRDGKMYKILRITFKYKPS
jgi:hypothetical protein